MFSVIIPLFNKADYINRTLESVKLQTLNEFEVIVIDDGSTDDSFKVAKDFLSKTSLDFQIIQQNNQGVSLARNNGVRIAKYKYIAFLDADDWWEPDFLMDMKNLILKYPDSGLWASKYYSIKNQKIRIPKINLLSDFFDGLINYFKVYSESEAMPVWTGSTIVNKSVFLSLNGFKPNLKMGEDFDLWIRISMKHSIAYINKALAYYNQDVDVNNRAIGLNFYKPSEHVLFQDFGTLFLNEDFKRLYDKLILYEFKKYWIHNINIKNIEQIIDLVNWKNQNKKDFIYYKLTPRIINFLLFTIRLFLSKLKKLLLK